MNLKELIEDYKKRKEILYVNIMIIKCGFSPAPCIKFNLNPTENGEYYLKNSEISIEELANVNIEDMEKIKVEIPRELEYQKYRFLKIEIMEKTVLYNPTTTLYKKLNQKLEDTYEQWINTEEKFITEESKKFFKDKDGIARSEHTKEEFMKKLDTLRGIRKQFE